MMIERLRIKEVADDHFAVLFSRGDARPYHNSKYRTLSTETEYSKDGGKVRKSWNLVELNSYHVREKLKFQYAEDYLGAAPGLIEAHLENLSFEWANIRPGAQHLIIDCANENLSPAKIVAWLNKNCDGDILTLEGKRRIRASFDQENDFLLARMRFS